MGKAEEKAEADLKTAEARLAQVQEQTRTAEKKAAEAEGDAKRAEERRAAAKLAADEEERRAEGLRQAAKRADEEIAREDKRRKDEEARRVEEVKRRGGHPADARFPGVVENGVAVKDGPADPKAVGHGIKKGTRFHAKSGHPYPPPIAALKGSPQHGTLLHWKEQADRELIHICPEDGKTDGSAAPCYYPLVPVLDEANGNQPLVVAVLTEDVDGVGRAGDEISLRAAGKVPRAPDGSERTRRALVHVCSWDPAHAGGRVLVRPPQRKAAVPEIDDIPKAKLVSRGFSSVTALLAVAALCLAALALAGEYSWQKTSQANTAAFPSASTDGIGVASGFVQCQPVVHAQDAGCSLLGGTAELDYYNATTGLWSKVAGVELDAGTLPGTSASRSVTWPAVKVADQFAAGRLYLRPVDVVQDGGAGCINLTSTLLCRTEP